MGKHFFNVYKEYKINSLKLMGTHFFNVYKECKINSIKLIKGKIITIWINIKK